ncbi:hypothetical protein JNM87_05350 [Candidatus Saccharibacteria bacterium]|nr:hypothetical protein [Candidatus Saccharibacteria bacterium]
MPANPRTTQFTVRNVPPTVSRYLRSRANATGKSMNAIIIEELTKNASAGPTAVQQNAFEKVKNMFGVGYDPEVAEILNEDEKTQKELMRKSWWNK